MKYIFKRLIILFILFILSPLKPVLAVDYPIIFIGGNAGYDQNDFNTALAMKGFFRYSLEGYFPGLQIECSYATQLNKPLSDFSEKVDLQNENIYQTQRKSHQVGLSGLLQIRPFGRQTIIYFGGGGNFNFLSCDSTWTEKYWDPEIDDFQELQHDPVNLFKANVPGYHAFIGTRFLLGSFGSLDFEVRKTFISTQTEDWNVTWAAQKYGEKKWDSLSFNAGLSINIF